MFGVEYTIDQPPYSVVLFIPGFRYIYPTVKYYFGRTPSFFQISPLFIYATYVFSFPLFRILLFRNKHYCSYCTHLKNSAHMLLLGRLYSVSCLNQTVTRSVSSTFSGRGVTPSCGGTSQTIHPPLTGYRLG